MAHDCTRWHCDQHPRAARVCCRSHLRPLLRMRGFADRGRRRLAHRRLTRSLSRYTARVGAAVEIGSARQREEGTLMKIGRWCLILVALALVSVAGVPAAQAGPANARLTHDDGSSGGYLSDYTL